MIQSISINKSLVTSVNLTYGELGVAEGNLYDGSVSLKLLGFGDADRLKFESIFAIAEGRLEASWELVNTAKADFYLLYHGLGSQIKDDPALSSLPCKQCIFYVTEAAVSEGSDRYELIAKSGSFPSLRSLTLLFNQLSETLNDDVKGQVESTVLVYHKDSPPLEEPTGRQQSIKPIQQELSKAEKPELIGENYFDLAQGLIGQLLSVNDEIYRFSLEVSNKSVNLYINCAEKVYYSQEKLELLDVFFVSEQVVSESISAADLEQELRINGLKPKPLNHLVWYSVFSCSQGRVRKGFKESDIIRLKRWPDINLPGCRGLIKLAAYMQSNAVELSVTQINTGFSMAQIYDFYNACYAVGLTEQRE